MTLIFSSVAFQDGIKIYLQSVKSNANYKALKTHLSSYTSYGQAEKTGLCALLSPAALEQGAGPNSKNPPKIRLKKFVKLRIILGPEMI